MCSNHELQATLNAFGYLEDGVYYKSKDSLNCAKDLVRYLRRDDPNEKTVRRELLKTDVISNDLIPLLKVLKDKKDAELFDLTLRLLVNLTQSAYNCFEMKIPEEKLKYNIYIEIDNFLKKTKEPFTDEKFIQVICEKLKEIVSKEWEDRNEEEDMIAERILFLIRNILQIKPIDDDGSNRLETDINSHDILILSLHNAHLFETLNEMAASSNFVKYSAHILEIIVLALRDQSPEELAKVSDKEVNLKSKRSVVEKNRDSDELAKLLNKDKQSKKTLNKVRINSRHSRFMGTYVATNMKSINDDNNLIVHKQARNMGDLLDDKSKTGVKKSKNKLALEAEETQHRSVLFIRIILKNFCFSFMRDSYNIFLRNIRDMIQRKKLEDEEVCFYYWLIQFLTEFNRNCEIEEQLKMEQIRETFSLELFHSTEIYIQRCIEMMRMDKKQSRIWSKRMHTSLRCYKENLVTLYVLEKKILAFNQANNIKPQENSQASPEKMNQDEEADLVDVAEKLMEVKPSSPTSQSPIMNETKSLLDERATHLLTKLKNQIFYVQEFRDLFITLLKDFDPNKMSKAFLRDLIEANHIFILLLEYHTKKNGVLSVMSKKKKKTKPKKDSKKGKKAKETKEEKEKRLADQKEYKMRLEFQKADFKQYCWQTQFSKIGSLMQNESELKCEEDNLMPFDFGMVTNDEDFDSQKNNVIEKIQTLLSKKKPDDSITLFREARSLWPKDKELFGDSQIEADEEFEVFKNLYMKELEIKKPEPKEIKKIPENEEDPHKNDDEGIEDDLNNEEIEEYKEALDGDVSDGNNEQYEEENLDFEKFLFRYTHSHVLKCFIMMLGEYAKNTDFLNRCCMSMFERIAYECHSTPSLYQLSLFNLINNMYKDPLSRCCMNILDTTSQKKSIDDIYASSYSTEDMFAFFRQLIAKFLEQAKKNDKLFLEVLFFKEKKILFSLGEDGGGYEAIQEANNKRQKCAWTQSEQDELKELYEKFNSENNNGEQNTNEGDIIDKLMLHISEDRKRRDICNQLVNIGCANSIDDFKETGAKKLGRNRLWRSEDLDDLKQCFKLVQENAEQSNRVLKDMMGQLQECLKIKRNKQAIADKLVEMDLIKDSSEILGSKKHRSKKDFLTDNMNDFVESDKSSNEEATIEKEKKKRKKLKKKAKKYDKANELFDAESGSSNSSSDSRSEDSLSESDSDKDDKEPGVKPMNTSVETDTEDYKINDKSKKSKQKLKLSEDNSSDGDENVVVKKKKSSKLQLSGDDESGDKEKKSRLELSEDDDSDEDINKVAGKKKKSSKLQLSESDESNAENEDLVKRIKKSSKLKLSEDDGSERDSSKLDSDNSNSASNNSKRKNKKKKATKTKRGRKKEDVLALILSDENKDSESPDDNIITNMLIEAKKTEEKTDSNEKGKKSVSSDELDSNTVDKPKENLKSDREEDIDEEKNESPIKTTKNVKKRKKKFKIIDDSSNSSANLEPSVKEKPITVLSEIVNSENSQNIKLNHGEVYNRTVAEPVENNSASSNDEESDDDMPLSMRVSMPKRQRLILSDGDDD